MSRCLAQRRVSHDVCDILAEGRDWSLCEERGLGVNKPRTGPKARQTPYSSFS